MVRLPLVVLVALALAGAVLEDARLVRVRLLVTTTASGVDINVEGATLASYTSAVTAGAEQVHASSTGHTLGLGRNIRGQTAAAQFDVVLTRVRASSVTWHVTPESPEHTVIEVYAVPTFDRPALVDRFDVNGLDSRFSSPAALLDAGAGLRLDRISPRLVFADFYPWYALSTWNDDQLADRPLHPYSTDDPADLASTVQQATGAGIDAFVVSWQGGPTDMYDQRFRRVLDAAAGSMKACAMLESFVANPTFTWDAPTDPQTMLDWIAAIVDRFGSHPAYLRVDGRPVIFVYASSRLQDAPWSDIRARLRASGRNPLLVGEQFESRLLNYFDGEYQYNNVGWPEPYRALYDAQGLRTRTFHLIRPGDQRRVWVASVTPGYDDQRLRDRDTHLTYDRRNGQVYDAMWSAAVQTDADWVIITSWNEWFENTEIEPSQRYGSYYLDRTRFWADQFKNDTREPRVRQP